MRFFSSNFSLGNDVQSYLAAVKEPEPEIDPHLLRFLDYLKVVEFNVQHPSADFLTCQHVIAQCYALRSNNYVK